MLRSKLGETKTAGSFLVLACPYRARDEGGDPFRGRCRPATMGEAFGLNNVEAFGLNQAIPKSVVGTIGD